MAAKINPKTIEPNNDFNIPYRRPVIENWGVSFMPSTTFLISPAGTFHFWRFSTWKVISSSWIKSLVSVSIKLNKSIIKVES